MKFNKDLPAHLQVKTIMQNSIRSKLNAMRSKRKTKS
uniref:Uncharacterized protein n=1 Tax=Siphoviridae sp. ctM5A27 TaxID=2825459 RepID=A0A8S5PGH7_9CAUD|nr:MAG TPA: hypothetical protein [Siphoviridae sp. ctM5A27]